MVSLPGNCRYSDGLAWLAWGILIGMISFMKLPRRSDAKQVTLADVLRKDISRWMLAGLATITLVYALGLIVSGSDSARHPLNYYVQVIFMYTPLAGVAVFAFASFMAVGLRSKVLFWANLVLLWLIWSSPFTISSLSGRLDPSRFLSAFCAMFALLSCIRLWQYYELRKVMKLSEPWLTRPALAAYVSLLILSAAALLLTT